MVKELHSDKYPFVRIPLYDVPSMLGDLAEILVRQGKPDEAEALYSRELAPLLVRYEEMLRRDKIASPGFPRVKETLQRLVLLYESIGWPERAIEWKEKLAEFDEQTRSTDAGETKAKTK